METLREITKHLVLTKIVISLKKHSRLQKSFLCDTPSASCHKTYTSDNHHDFMVTSPDSSNTDNAVPQTPYGKERATSKLAENNSLASMELPTSTKRIAKAMKNSSKHTQRYYKLLPSQRYQGIAAQKRILTKHKKSYIWTCQTPQTPQWEKLNTLTRKIATWSASPSTEDKPGKLNSI